MAGYSARIKQPLVVILAASAAVVAPLLAQQPARSVTAADYARAERFLTAGVAGLVVGGNVAANWLGDDRFWYRTATADGTTQTIIVDEIKKTRTICGPA